MTERTFRDRLHALGPLILRMGIACVLVQDGLERAGPILPGDDALVNAEEVAVPVRTAASATPDGFRLDADWAALLGAGEVAAAGLLVVGFFTRLVVAPMLVMLAFGLSRGFSSASLPANTAAMALLAAGCLSLLVSGGGAFSVSRLLLGRRSHGRTEPEPRDYHGGHGQFISPDHSSWVQRWRARVAALWGGRSRGTAEPARRWLRRRRTA